MSAFAAATAQKMQPINEEHSPLSLSAESVVIKQILDTHSPDGGEVDTEPLLNFIMDILKQATLTSVMTPQTHMEAVEDRAHPPAVVGTLKALANTIHSISCEMTCKCTSGGDVEATTVALFHILSSYTWDAKVILVLAAFAANYGEFWLLVQPHAVNPLAKPVSLLKQLPDITEHIDTLKPRFDAIDDLVNAILKVTTCIIEFKKLPSKYIPDSPFMPVLMTDIPTAAYQTIRSVVACATQITMLLGLGHEYTSFTIELSELTSLAGKVRNIHGHLTEQLALCYRYIKEHKDIEAYQTIERLFQTVHIDNVKILRTFICSKDDLPLMDGDSKTKVNVDALRRKIVMFFISDLDISHEELSVLVQIYRDTHQEKPERPYEIVWLPVIDRRQPGPGNGSEEKTFNDLASMMPWYLLHDRLLLDAPVIKYIRDAWRFKKKPLLVVLDRQGKVVCPNALHMMRIWGTLDFSFPINQEETLWNKQPWQLKFLIDKIDPEILTKVGQDHYVCLYGGEDIKWIQDFTTHLNQVEKGANITFEKVYVGKSNPKKRAREDILAKITDNKLGGYWQEPKMWLFWARLESIWYSRMQLGKTIEDDPIMQDVMKMLSYDGSDEGWALIGRRSGKMVTAQGKKLIDCLTKLDKWKATEEEPDFIQALTKELALYRTDEHCTCFILPGDTGRIRELVLCTECKRPMKKFILYRCCND